MYCIGTDVSFGTPYDTLAARFVSPAGVVGSEITLATGGELPDDGLARFNDPPAVAFNGNNYLVTWMQHNGDSSNDVYGVLVSKTGTVSTPFRISQNTSTSHNPMNVASDGSNFFVVWPYDTGDGSEDPALWELHGRLVTADGGFDSAEFTVAGVTNLPFLPYIAFDGANYFVTWTDQSDSSDWNITGQFVTQTGALLGSPLNLVTCPGNQVLSPVVYGAGNDLVLWNDGTNIDFDNFNATAIKGLFIPVAPTTVATPNIAGKTAGDANTAIVGANLVVGTITTAYSNTVAVGKVISQSPAAGTKVATGSTVSYVRSLGKPVVPNVVGMAAADANTAITSVDNLKVGTITTAYSNTVDAGNVISQNPTASKTVAIGSKVKYVRSLGKKPIVPNVVGMAASDANTAIVNANLVVGTITTKYSNTVDAGKVISQNPAAGKAVAIGSKVKYVRSLGKKP
jgi:beta-lactam-binding protein with PASTA domain